MISIPKKIRNIYPKIYEYENLYWSYRNARKSKRFKNEVLCFSYNLEENLINLQNHLIHKTYCLGEYHSFYVHEPKKRLVMALPFKDRVVQWAIYRKLCPIFDKVFYEHSCACRKGKGTHYAANQLQYWLRKLDRSPGKTYYLKADIAKYFYRVNHRRLIKIIARKIGCSDTLNLLWKIIKKADGNFGIRLDDHEIEEERIGGIGMPIGNLTSQLFANIYLDWLDIYVKHVLKVKYYIRYMDDFILLAKSKKRLHVLRKEIDIFLDEYLCLQLNNKTAIRPISLGIDFMGYVIWPTHMKLRKSTKKRMKRRLKQLRDLYQSEKVGLDKVDASVQSYLGICQHCSSHNLAKSILEGLIFIKGAPIKHEEVIECFLMSGY